MQFVPYSSYCDVCRLPVFARPAPDPPRLRHGQARVPRRPLHAAHDRLNREHGFLMGPHAPHLDKPPAEVYPLAASCAACKTDASAQDDMKRCSACRMTRCVFLSRAPARRLPSFSLLPRPVRGGARDRTCGTQRSS
ncbi:hypothetical protein DICSQDRAFT_140805 [Dichomitus squalens LYAD-421 SS1]|uniref:Uncharacterized protein n=1 Tax=Dichomitus squalens (strain LYAD-421) TaxID=732165 RepID=R7SL37_DICSQ|nr:uncharacterized protein DICSQDRAFT_140805 [Dichomitus squalens LYAD-421 SS1]EJF56871.1 hypothetical protein DICSQDRAFT_140805 [Dichomitus squalens LYAD-421 SS1]